LGVDPLKKIESHPFGDLITQFLSRRHGLSQNKLAEYTDVHPTTISRMCNGQRLTGPKARERVLKFIHWFCDQGVIKSLGEANELLAASGQLGLDSTVPQEASLIQRLESSTDAQKEPGKALDRSTASSLPRSRQVRLITRRDMLMILIGAALTYLFGPVYGLLRVLVASPRSDGQALGFFLSEKQWLVISEAQDDRNVIVVNRSIAGVVKDAGWISIDGYLRRDGEPNDVTLVNINGPGPAKWKMFIGYNDARWPREGVSGTRDEHHSFESWRFQIDLDSGAEEPVKEISQEDWKDTARPTRRDEAWKVRMTMVDDAGLVMVNGVVVAAAYVDYQFSPFEIGEWLYADGPNEVLVMIWNTKGEACGDITIWKGENVRWILSDEFGEGKIGEIYRRRLIIDEAGNVIDARSSLDDTGL